GSNVVVTTDNEMDGKYLEYITPKSNSKLGLPLSEVRKAEVPGLQAKVDQWKKFSDYMSDMLGMQADKDKEGASQSSNAKSKAQEPRNSQFITHFARLDSATMFRFDNGGFQVNFSS